MWSSCGWVATTSGNVPSAVAQQARFRGALSIELRELRLLEGVDHDGAALDAGRRREQHELRVAVADVEQEVDEVLRRQRRLRGRRA